jgi:multiple sugar transport system permease protein
VRRGFRSGRIGTRAWIALAVVFGLGLLAAALWQTRAPDDRQEIIFWGGAAFGEEIYNVIHRFEQRNPQYRVVLSTAATRDLTGDAQRLLTAVAGGVPPDVVWFDRFAIGEWAGRGALTDLSPLLAAQSPDDPYRIDLGDYYDFAVKEASYSPPGTDQPPGVFGIPVSIDVRGLYVNSDQLRQAGIVDAQGNPRPPQTWEELRDAANRLTRRNDRGQIIRLGFAPNFGNSWFYMYAWQAGGEFMNPERTRVTLDAPENVRALRFMADVYDDLGGYAAVDAFRMTFQGGALDPFVRGQVAMKIDGDFFLNTLAEWNRDMDFQFLPAPLPADRLAAGAEPITWSGGFAMIIPATAKQKEGAWQFIQYLCSWEAVSLMQRGVRERREAEGKLYLPPGQGNRVFFERLIEDAIYGNPDVPAPFKQAYDTFRVLLRRTLIRPVTPVGQLLWNQHIRAFEAGVSHVHRGEAERLGVDEMKLALQRAQVDVQAQLERVLSPPPPAVVNWTPYFLAYAVMVLAPFAALLVAYKRRRKEYGYKAREVGWALVFLSPWVLGFVLFVAGPILFSIVMSFTRYDVLSSARYVGLENYAEVTTDPLVLKSLGNSLFMLVRVPIVLAVSLAVALLLNRATRMMGVYRTCVYLPTIMPLVAASILWIWLLNPTQGLINGLLQLMIDSPLGSAGEWAASLLTGTDVRFTPPSWLQDPDWSKPALIVMNAWMCGGSIIIWLAGLQSINPSLLEAASIDGAGPVRRFFTVTLPMLSPYVLFNLIIGVIGTLQIFDEAYVMTSGGPVDSTLFYAYHLFRQAFQYFRMGYAAALAWVLFVMVLALTILQLWLSKRWVHYEHA